MSAALLNCPFCGGIAKNVSAGVAGPSIRFHAGDSIFAVNCSQCGGSVPNRYRNELVVEAWNRRASTATPPAQEVSGKAVAELVPDFDAPTRGRQMKIVPLAGDLGAYPIGTKLYAGAAPPAPATAPLPPAAELQALFHEAIWFGQSASQAEAAERTAKAREFAERTTKTGSNHPENPDSSGAGEKA